MYRTTQNFFPLHTVFHSGYFPELDCVETHRTVSFLDGIVKVDRTIKALTGAMFAEMTKSLRSALAL
jgi:hypothetical protein